MTDAPPDVPLRATELQMRRVLGLDRKAPPASQPTHSSTPSNGLHQRRHFVRDGEVPTTVIHSDRGSRLQQLEAMRQALQERTAAREEADRLLLDARNAVRDLETKLAHERLAKYEMAQRASAERQKFEEALAAVQDKLAAELRMRSARERDDAFVARQTTEQRLRQVTVSDTVKDAPSPAGSFPSGDPPTRRRGRPPKTAGQADPDDADVVEWWVPGWQQKYR